MMRYARIGVVGAGVMGAGVAQNLVQTGHRVLLVDVADDVLRRALADVRQGLRHAMMFDAELRKGSLDELVERIEITTDLRRLADVDLVVENATESWATKETIYRDLDAVCRGDCIFAANTSAIPITRIAETTCRPDRVVGMHFMNPVPQKKVVEVIRGRWSSETTVQAATDFLGQMGKRAIIVADSAGFVINRVLMLAINEAASVVREGVSTPADVDQLFVGCLAHRMGPLATADLIGLDTVLRTLHVLRDSRNDTKYEPCPLLVEMVDAGRLGRKSGRGFFNYPAGTGGGWT